MEKMIAYCGIVCSECDAYIATQTNDDALRAKIASEWSKTYGGQFKIEDINCDGCTSKSSRLIGHCSECSIRACGLLKNVANCGHCNDYACEQLNAFFSQVAAAKETLDQIAKERSGK